jgi:hypothetical protein
MSGHHTSFCATVHSVLLASRQQTKASANRVANLASERQACGAQLETASMRYAFAEDAVWEQRCTTLSQAHRRCFGECDSKKQRVKASKWRSYAISSVVTNITDKPKEVDNVNAELEPA